MKRFFAFTLAETLIVMGIIGIVSALTLPNLNSSTGEKEKVAKVKKIYQNLTDAFGRAQAVYGPYDEWIQASDSTYVSQSTRFGERITEFMKISKSCGTSTGCWSTAPLKDIDDNYYAELKPDHVFYILSDGTALAIEAWKSYGDTFLRIRVDIDGPNKGKTQVGSDIFDFSNRDASLGTYNYLYPSIKREFTNLGINSEDNYVTAWVIENENLDYLKCADKLKWDEKTSCK